MANLLIYGIEGKKYYEFVDKEKVGFIDYPEGVTADDLAGRLPHWHFPNELIAPKVGYGWS